MIVSYNYDFRKKNYKARSWWCWRINRIWRDVLVSRRSIKRSDWMLLKIEPSKYLKLPRQKVKDLIKPWTGYQMHCKVENDQYYVRVIYIRALQGD